MVVLASRIHPSALSGYSGKFKALLSSGAIVGLQASGATSADGGMSAFALDRIAGLKSTIVSLEKERDRLKELLDGAAKNGGGAEGDAAKLEAERDRIREALEHSEGDLLETRHELAAALDSAETARTELETAVRLVTALSEKLAAVETAQRARMEALDEALAALDQDLESLAGNGPAEGDPALAAYDALVAEKRAAEAELDGARRETAQGMAKASVWAGEVQGLLDRTSALLMEADESFEVDEARKNVTEAIVRLVRVSGGLASPASDAAEGGTGLLPKRGMPGGDALSDVVKKAFGDPVEEDEDDDDFTYAEPLPEEDEPDLDLDRL
jgi:hypothetical protein